MHVSLQPKCRLGNESLHIYVFLSVSFILSSRVIWTNDFMHGDSHIPRPTNQWFFFSHTLCLSVNIATFSLPLLLIIAFSFLRLLFFHFIALLIFYNHCYFEGKGADSNVSSLHVPLSYLLKTCPPIAPHSSLTSVLYSISSPNCCILRPFLFVSLLHVIPLGKWMFCDVVYSPPNRFLWHSFTFCAPICNPSWDALTKPESASFFFSSTVTFKYDNSCAFA